MLITRPITMKVKVSTKIKSRSMTIGSPQIIKTNQPRQKQHHVKRPQEDRGKLVSSATAPWNSNDGRFIRPLRLFSQLFLDFSCTRSSMSLRLSSSFVSFIHLTTSLENRQSNCSKRFTKDNLQKRRRGNGRPLVPPVCFQLMALQKQMHICTSLLYVTV